MDYSPFSAHSPDWSFRASPLSPIPNAPPRSPLRQQIIEESIQHARAKNWTKPAKYPGMATFDLNNGLRQMPFAKSPARTGQMYDSSISGEDGQSTPSSSFSHGPEPNVSASTMHFNTFALADQGRYIGPTIQKPFPNYEGSKGKSREIDFPETGYHEHVCINDIPEPGSERFSPSKPYPDEHKPSIHDDVMRELNEIHRAASEGESAHCRVYSNDGIHWPERQSENLPTIFSESGRLQQPETRSVTEDQLVAEVKGIYAGLVMVEKKCIEIVQQQSQKSTKLTTEQWQALIALHRTLMHEHHDFFAASQHPTASSELKTLARRYIMPWKMWEQGMHGFIELLRRQFPGHTREIKHFLFLHNTTLKALQRNVPSMREHWTEIEEHMRRYIQRLRKYGFELPDEPLDDFKNNESIYMNFSDDSPGPSWRFSEQQNSFEEEVLEDYFRSRLRPLFTPEEAQAAYEKTPLKLSDVALHLASGWLLYGQELTKNKDFNIFCRVFKLIVFIGALMSAGIGQLPL